MKYIALIVSMITLAAIGYTVTVNPASMVTADSANTALTIVYRDSNGAFSAGAIDTAVKSETIAELLAETPASVGVERYCNNCSPLKMVVSTGTAAGNWADPAGAAFK